MSHILLKEYIKAIIISFEFLIIIAALFFYFNIDCVIPFSSAISVNVDLFEHVAWAPLLMFVWVFKEAKKILSPEDDIKKIIQGWPDYWKLKIHFYVGLFYSLFFALTGVVAFATGHAISTPQGFVLLISPVFGGAVVVLSFYMAQIKQMEIFRTCSKG